MSCCTGRRKTKGKQLFLQSEASTILIQLEGVIWFSIGCYLTSEDPGRRSYCQVSRHGRGFIKQGDLKEGFHPTEQGIIWLRFVFRISIIVISNNALWNTVFCYFSLVAGDHCRDIFRSTLPYTFHFWQPHASISKKIWHTKPMITHFIIFQFIELNINFEEQHIPEFF